MRLISPDCGIAKANLTVVVAPLFPTQGLPQNELDGLRADTRLNAFLLPSAASIEFADDSRSPWPECFVDLARATSITQGLIADERMIALGESHSDRLQERLVRYFALKELSSTGTLEGMVGRTIAGMRVTESSRRRHTVEITLDNGGTIVLYQEPRRRGPHLETITIRQGRFSRPPLHAIATTELRLRFENEDPRDYVVACPEAAIVATRLAAADTTEVTLRCPSDPGELILTNLGMAEERISIQVEPL